MGRIDPKTAVILLLAVATALVFAYGIDQYYIAGKGYIFFFDILKL